MKHLLRLGLILAIFSLSMIVIHAKKGLKSFENQKFKVVCIPANLAAKADRHFNQLAQIAHTSLELEGSQKSYRCYFKFSPKDAICASKSLAMRQEIHACPKYPTLSSGMHKQCYIVNRHIMPLIAELQKKPPISRMEYAPRNDQIFDSWQKAREALRK